MNRRRHKPAGRRGARTILLSVLAVVVALSAAVWLSAVGPLGTKNTADGTSVRTSASPDSAASSLSIAPTASSASPSASPSRASASASPTPKPSANTSSAAALSSSGPTAASTGTHLITIVNADNVTIWAATNPNAQHPIPVTGWKLAPGQSVSFTVPDGWGGRVWGRTGCSFNSAGVGHCQTGDCGGLFQCKGGEGGATTLAELTLDSFDGLDFYDVSMVDGANLPMYINTTHRTGADPISPTGCYQGACTKAVVCPTGMQVKANGQYVACETACAAFGGDAYCCTGSWSGRANCDPAKWPVDYAKLVFKDAEPYAYSYAFDDSATMACKGHCNYRITFGITP